MRTIGTSIQRVEDNRVLTGRGRYVDDISLPGMLHAAFLRSPHPHARVTRVDVEAARGAPGVVAVLTGADMQRLTRPMAIQTLPGYRSPQFYPLASDRVRFVGDPVAIVVADSRYVAEDALELIEVDYEPLPPVATIEHALDESRPALFEELGGNVVYQDSHTYGDLDAAFARADRVVRATFRQHRYANVPMETRGAVAHFDPSTGELTYYAATQSPHGVRFTLSGVLPDQPVHLTRVVSNDVGGAFGLKGFVYREDVALAAASKHLGRPVKWIEDRNEHLMASAHAREEDVSIEAAVTNDGRLLGIRANLTMNQGAYPLLPFPSAFFTSIMRVMLPGPYRLEGYRFDSTVVASNKAPYVAYRAPWEVETWVRERLLDLIAREVGIDPIEVRRRNMVTAEEQPVPMITGPSLERMSARQTLDRAVELMDYPGFLQAQRQAREAGRYLGLGIATFIEAAPGPRNMAEALGFSLGKERARVRLEPDGHLTVVTAQMPHGQGHETTLAQVAADEMGVPFEHVKVAYGDTRYTPFSLIGTGGSRSATMASGAVLYGTRQVKATVLKIAAGLLEASPADLEIDNAVISVRGAPQRAVPLGQVATLLYLAPDHLPPDVDTTAAEADYGFDGDEGGWAQATHACWVEVDPGTGQVKIDRYLVVEDCGTMINPAIVEGQVRGGVAQGIGGVLYEHAAYDQEGQFLAGTFMDYLLPTTTEIPRIEIDHLETPPISPVNFRGVGEGGALVAPAALTNAIEDALAPLGVKITEQWLPPVRLLELIGAIA
jgi:carbon-monoxide dehydrogenase large subunit